MTKFKVGDKVRFIEDYMDYKKGDTVEVIGFWDEGINYIGKGKSTGCYFSRVELVETKPTKNQRITALENEVAELKLIVHGLRDGRKTMRDVMNEVLSEPSTTNTVEDIIEYEGQQYKKVDREAHEGDVVVFDKSVKFHGTEIVTKGKLYKAKKGTLGELAFVDNEGDSANVYDGGITKFTPENVAVYELIKPKPLTPNQQRAAIIEKAKGFIEESKNVTGGITKRKGYLYGSMHLSDAEFVVNAEKRTVVCLLKEQLGKKLSRKGIAKCNPNDVFNEHIGKAIALGRALGLDVSEFEQAVQPSHYAIGQIVTFPKNDCDHMKKQYEVKSVESIGSKLWGLFNGGFNADGGDLTGSQFEKRGNRNTLPIINDTDAIYGGVE